MGLKEALRLKSFDSKELDIRATKTPKGDPPYLSIVHENLYQIREPEAPGNQGGPAVQGGSVGQGGSGSGFKAAHDSVRSVEEVPGYDVGAQDALDAAIKAFDDLHISVLGKVADLVDKPLSVIQQRSKLPIVGEDDNEV
ncbi:hypothetical protein HanXRQr2_Chr09g0376831 [Helianthus annuus]|uniref:Uncharacterized protein n=1 Tax=Helianthus annuus TaxID=4232 RepID=A0A9K3I437_HELAN|nr:hypothetical protein HanXRQr2_Chr09g0376831 [Helianthus annuus]KAJ0533254.1 hypothetical protein HanIR_Chr09g0406291 [Helianthus annuus]KAJ0541575.1 hypothetical protein HanHA89_Chr09g0330031 [Helianthus annuus]KAJ0706649.1 hypothetical protein HanLR1_Chr09g0309461 [Helianthus annuus]KAJ0892218.1 hypothetical protein HanPSC8_Chr09g0363291 [Helianthus annuus]